MLHLIRETMRMEHPLTARWNRPNDSAALLWRGTSNYIVPVTGVEPANPSQDAGPANPVRLPFRHTGLVQGSGGNV
jgi:hypothetical protein